MKLAALVLLALIAGSSGHAQEAELPPIVVTGTFELAPKPSVTDLFTQHFLKQLETKRALEEAVARSPWYYSRFWNYLAIRLEPSSLDPAQFFTPRYLTSEYQNVEQSLRKSEKHSLFAP